MNLLKIVFKNLFKLIHLKYETMFCLFYFLFYSHMFAIISLVACLSLR